MKVAKRIIGFCVLALFGVVIYTSCKPVWQFDHFEKNARRAVTGTELQVWATNLLARHPEYGGVRRSEFGADFPKQLDRLAPKLGPMVYIQMPEDTNFPAYVQLSWGGGILGHLGFEVGPTNFTGFRSQRAWQPGVYFFKF
jgi:hypothetical protein